jgi:hypothetical protein
MRAVPIAAKKPIRYNAISNTPLILKGPKFWSGTAAEISNVYTGKRAEQLIKGVTNMVISLSF